ncbi:ferrochelatase-2, chloroplastic-like protein [Tanacetum coccineum]
MTLGERVLKARSIFPQTYWYWIGLGALLGYNILSNGLFTIFLSYLNPLGGSQTVVSEERNDKDGKKNSESVVIQLRELDRIALVVRLTEGLLNVLVSVLSNYTVDGSILIGYSQDKMLSRLHVVIIQSWYQREGYVKSMADLIQKELQSFGSPEEVMIFFSAHGVPETYVRDAGDLYRDQMEECIYLIMQEQSNRSRQ